MTKALESLLLSQWQLARSGRPSDRALVKGRQIEVKELEDEYLAAHGLRAARVSGASLSFAAPGRADFR
jgi:hypothetical protein